MDLAILDLLESAMKRTGGALLLLFLLPALGLTQEREQFSTGVSFMEGLKNVVDIYAEQTGRTGAVPIPG